MPELPEVETLMRGLIPHLENIYIETVILRHTQLRWPISTNLNNHLSKQQILKLSRRGKYLLISFSHGTLIIHLGMSGSLKLLNTNILPKPHDHVDIILSNHTILRYHDPRRFGAILWTEDDPFTHPLLKSIGIEPFDPFFNSAYLYERAKKRLVPIKNFLMNGTIVAGIGNIYAAETLFLAKIHPLTASRRLTKLQWEQVVSAIQTILAVAITAGGTTLKDFVNSEGKPGYFSQELMVYGRGNLPCKVCSTLLQSIQLAKRSTVFCPQCQAL